MKKQLLLILIVCLFPLATYAKNLSNMYTRDTLSYWKSRYKPNIEWNWRNLVLGKLTQAEKAQLGQVKLRFPLIAEAQVLGDPLAFYSSSIDSSVTIPVLSVKFFDDLSIAYAWLEENNYSIETVTDYIAMLKYKTADKFPNTRYPEPFQALGIPRDATDNKIVNDLSQKILKSAILWIMSHELGHIYYRHHGSSPINEVQADRFATEILRRVGVAPAGIVHFFLASAHWVLNRGDFPDDSAWDRYLREGATHPLTSDRLKALSSYLYEKSWDFASTERDQVAAQMRVKYIASQVSGISDILTDPDIQRSVRVKGLSTTLDMVKPRRKGSLHSGHSTVDNDLQQSEKSFHGAFVGIYGHYLRDGRKEELPVQITLRRSGERVRGWYYFGLGRGSIEGAVISNRLYFNWRWGDDTGKGVLEPKNGGSSFVGSWGYGESRDNGGTMAGQRN